MESERFPGDSVINLLSFSSEQIRIVSVIPPDIPKISLVGMGYMSHEKGTLFLDPGVDSFSRDGTLLNLITEGSVDVFSEGEYQIKYAVEDQLGNRSRLVERIVQVVDENFKFLDWVKVPQGVVISGSDEQLIGSVRIPNKIEGMPVIGIGSNAFSGNTALTEIIIPEGVTEIGASAFSGCGNLESISLPSTLKSIGSECFTDCRGLQAVHLPEGLETLGHFDDFKVWLR